MAALSTIALVVLVTCLCIVDVRAARDVPLVRRSTFAGTSIPVGWWHSLKPKNGTSWCGLRDFPPRNNGYGASRLYCVFPTYNHYWMWRVLKVGNSSSSLSSGDEVFLTIYNPMPFKFCQLRSNVMCGYENGTRFVIEKASGAGPIQLSSDDVVLRVGTGYCSLVGSGHGQAMTCRATRAAATVFQLPASSFAHTQLRTRLTAQPCGGYFYPLATPVPDTVACSNPIAVGFSTNLTLSLRNPGNPLISAGTPIGFKTYDDKYTYHVTTWMQRNTTVFYTAEQTEGDGQWFTLERTSGAATGGGALLNGTQVVLRSTRNGTLYCGQRALNATALRCDLPGPVSSLPEGYKYTYLIIP